MKKFKCSHFSLVSAGHTLSLCEYSNTDRLNTTHSEAPSENAQDMSGMHYTTNVIWTKGEIEAKVGFDYIW